MISPITTYISIALGVLAFILPRRYFLAPYILAACFIPADQRIIIMELDFTPLRILVLVGVLRIFLSNEESYVKWNKFDLLILMWVTCKAIVYVIQWGTIKALINRSGVMFDVIGLYWIFRQNIRSWDDVRFAAQVLAVSVLVLIPLIAFEWATGQNPFVLLGRVKTVIRAGEHRCQASFPHSIMLGLFWANVVPIFIAFAKAQNRGQYLYWLGAAAVVFIVFAVTSSTPVVTMMTILGLIALFRYRRYGRYAFYSLCVAAVGLHMIMNKPVWHLISRVQIRSGSAAYHRYKLIDKAVENFGEWALLGTRSCMHWGYGLGDTTNQYVLEGVRGGVITLALFIMILVTAVRTLGWYSLRPMMPLSRQWLAWGMCVSMLGHCISFLGVSYFGQITMLLYFSFAVVGSIYETAGKAGFSK